jgi:hypothetical protein
MIFDDWQKKDRELQISRSLLWEYDLTDFPWHEMRTTVIQRVIERGWMEDFYAAIRIYGGIEQVREIIKEIPQLTNKDMAFVCSFFNLNKEELRCYTRKQSREQHLRS